MNNGNGIDPNDPFWVMKSNGYNPGIISDNFRLNDSINSSPSDGSSTATQGDGDGSAPTPAGSDWINKLKSNVDNMLKGQQARQLGSDIATLGQNFVSDQQLRDDRARQTAQEGVTSASQVLNALNNLYAIRGKNLASTRGLNAAAGL